ncbi:MAG: protein-L-isoaspartate O-methyltransferase [Patescibacteria group bacterium]
MSKLINQLIEQKYLKTPVIIEAFKKIKRADFVPREIIKEKGEEFVNEYNAPLPISYGQTISQPLTVAFMLELLKPKQGNIILDIGSGSGWQTAMLCEIVGDKGFIYAIELVPELKNFGQDNVLKYNFKNVEFICGDGSNGLLDKAPFDRIIAAAAANEIPKAWKEQLKIDGRIVAPVRNSIWLLVKNGKDKFEEKEYPGFAFVPLIENNK